MFGLHVIFLLALFTLGSVIAIASYELAAVRAQMVPSRARSIDDGLATDGLSR